MSGKSILKTVACGHCDFSSGTRGMDRCVKCDGAGSVFIVGKRFPNTRDGYEAALEARVREVERERDEARAANATYRDVFAEITAKAVPAGDSDPVRHYRIQAGPIHRAAGKLGFQMFDGERHLARAVADLAAAEARASAMAGALEHLVKAWNALPVGDYPPRVIAQWLRDDMKPAIDAARALLTPPPAADGEMT